MGTETPTPLITVCEVCGGGIAYGRSWPAAGGPGTANVYIEGKRVKNAHLGCWRLLRRYER